MRDGGKSYMGQVNRGEKKTARDYGPIRHQWSQKSRDRKRQVRIVILEMERDRVTLLWRADNMIRYVSV